MYIQPAKLAEVNHLLGEEPHSFVLNQFPFYNLCLTNLLFAMEEALGSLLFFDKDSGDFSYLFQSFSKMNESYYLQLYLK